MPLGWKPEVGNKERHPHVGDGGSRVVHLGVKRIRVGAIDGIASRRVRRIGYINVQVLRTDRDPGARGTRVGINRAGAPITGHGNAVVQLAGDEGSGATPHAGI